MEAGSGQPPIPPQPPQQPPPQPPQAPTQPVPVQPPPAQPPQAQPPTTESRLEGLRGWVAQVDRKLGVRTYAGAAAIIIALAASIVAVVLATSAKDESATKGEVQALRDQVEAVQVEASESASEDLSAITTQLDELEEKVNSITSSQRTTESELSVVQDDIDELRSQNSSGRGSP